MAPHSARSGGRFAVSVGHLYWKDRGRPEARLTVQSSHATRCLRIAVALEFQAEPRHGQYLTGVDEDVPFLPRPSSLTARLLAMAFQRFGAVRATLLLCEAGLRSRGAARDPPPRPS